MLETCLLSSKSINILLLTLVAKLLQNLYFPSVRKFLVYSLSLFRSYLHPFVLLASFPCGSNSSSDACFLDVFVERNPLHFSFHLEIKQTTLPQSSHSSHHPAV